MNSSADDFDFPPNPFRSAPASEGTHQQPHEDFEHFATQQQHLHDPLSSNNGGFQQQQHFAGPTNAGQARTVATSMQLPTGMMDTKNAPDVSDPAIIAAPTSRLEACIACTRMDTYRSYFDIDTIDIQNRIKSSVLMCYLPDKFRVQVIGVERNATTKGPDLYGPLWITMTLVFFLAFTSNMSAYFRTNPNEFEYDVTHLIRAMTVCFSFSFGVPALFWVLTQCMAMQALLMVEWICLYGYSMVVYLPTALLCLVPIEIWVWLCLITATAMSGLLVVRNVAAPLLSTDTTGSKAGPLLMAVMASHVIFLIVLKLAFYQ